MIVDSPTCAKITHTTPSTQASTLDITRRDEVAETCIALASRTLCTTPTSTILLTTKEILPLFLDPLPPQATLKERAEALGLSLDFTKIDLLEEVEKAEASLFAICIELKIAIPDESISKAKRSELLRKQITSLEKYPKTLNLSHKSLTYLPPEIGDLINLSTLLLHSNELTTIPPEISFLKNLNILHLHNNHLEGLPPQIIALTELKALNLANNHLKTFPSEICFLTKLKMLYLCGNQLTTIPSEIGSLTDLEILDLEYNQIENLPHELSFLKKLKSLFLSKNRLKTIPDSINELSSLTLMTILCNFFEKPLPLQIATCSRREYQAAMECWIALGPCDKMLDFPSEKKHLQDEGCDKHSSTQIIMDELKAALSTGKLQKKQKK